MAKERLPDMTVAGLAGEIHFHDPTYDMEALREMPLDAILLLHARVVPKRDGDTLLEGLAQDVNTPEYPDDRPAPHYRGTRSSHYR